MKRSRDSLYWRGSVLAFRYQDKDGRWREKFTGTADRTEAKDVRKKFLDDVEKDAVPTKKADWTVNEAAKRWVEQHAARLGSLKAQRNELSYFRQLTRRLGAKRLKAITLDDLKDYQQERRKTVRERPINLELQILVNVLKEANLWRGTLLHYKRLSEPESEVGIALISDQLRQLEAAAAKRDTWLVAYCAEILAANTGLRGGEIKKLRISMIDLENRRIRVARDSTKTDAGARIVELNQSATEVVCKLCVRAQTLGAKEAEHFLLPADLGAHTKVGDPLRGEHGFDPNRHQESWGTSWRNLRKAAADAIVEKAAKENRELTPDEKETVATFRTLRFHTLRHTFVTMMGERGVPLQVIGAMVGHMSPAMVRYYTHISNSAARDAVELLDLERPKTKRPALVGSLVGSRPIVTARVSKLLN